MINPEIKKDLESIVVRLDDDSAAEAATKSALLTVLAAIDTNQEQALKEHLAMFARRLLKALSARMASRN